MDVSTFEDSFNGDRLQTVIDGQFFEPKDVKRAARAFAVVTDNESMIDEHGPHIRVFLKGRGWEDSDGHPVNFDRATPVAKIGRTYYHVAKKHFHPETQERMSGDVMRLKRSTGEHEFRKVIIRSNGDSYTKGRTEI